MEPLISLEILRWRMHYAHYYSTLKEDAHSNPDCTGKVFFHAEHLGYQKGTYWLLSPDVSLFVSYSVCLATVSRCYAMVFTMDNPVHFCALQVLDRLQTGAHVILADYF